MCMKILLCIIIKVSGAIVVKRSVFFNNWILRVCGDLCICIYMDMCVYIYIQFLRKSVSYMSLGFRVINVPTSPFLLYYKQIYPLGIFHSYFDLIQV